MSFVVVRRHLSTSVYGLIDAVTNAEKNDLSGPTHHYIREKLVDKFDNNLDAKFGSWYIRI